MYVKAHSSVLSVKLKILQINLNIKRSKMNGETYMTYRLTSNCVFKCHPCSLNIDFNRIDKTGYQSHAIAISDNRVAGLKGLIGTIIISECYLKAPNIVPRYEENV